MQYQVHCSTVLSIDYMSYVSFVGVCELPKLSSSLFDQFQKIRYFSWLLRCRVLARQDSNGIQKAAIVGTTSPPVSSPFLPSPPL